MLVQGQTRPTITKSKLFEVSIADVGANDNALVHIKQYGVAAVLADVDAAGEHPEAIAVEAVIGYSYSFSHFVSCSILTAILSDKSLTAKKV